MRFLFVAPRYHTNQVEIVKGLKDREHEVEFWVKYTEKIENYSELTPKKIDKSNIFCLFLREKSYIPSCKEVYLNLKRYKPEVVIVRDINLFSFVVSIISKFFVNSKVILYTQDPTLIQKNESYLQKLKRRIKRIIGATISKVAYSPVEVANVDNIHNKNNLTNSNIYFVPFVVKELENTMRKYFKNNKINILIIGKYRPYKNLDLILKSLKYVNELDRIKITILGQVSNLSEKSYFERLQKQIEIGKYEDIVKLEANVEHSEISKIYNSNDIFILTSKKEIASISILEAMSYGLCVLSTNINGTASYLQNSDLIFESENEIDLANKLNHLINNKKEIINYGREASIIAKTSTNFESYYNRLNEILVKEFNFPLLNKEERY
ncbi:glycosyltransferase family 4 protein [Exiguobacterium aurantiacum]|uniref:glycosyltransferase family 4 protein n=1 Tax=Exiguobacterium aurantiacum TaxID=33987 RepID=UPI003D07D13F